MKGIIKITVKSESGYCPYDLAYEDKLIISSDSLTYEYKPYYESDENKSRKWKYCSADADYKEWFERVTAIVQETIPIDPLGIYTDIGAITFILKYDDKTSDEYSYFVPPDRFEDIWKIVRLAVPSIEKMPEVLIEYNDEEE